jgi:uncharacterized protein
MTVPTDEEVADILARSCNIAIVGCSRDPSRPSREVAAYLKEHGYRVFPVNPSCAGEIMLGERVCASLAEIGEPIDLVNVFRRPEHLGDVARDALRIAAPVFWMQSGIDSEEARAILTAAGRRVIADRCIRVEHQRLSAAT